MAKTEKSLNKVKELCEVFEKLIISISDIYQAKETSKDQKRFIETILGAAIWYLPHGERYWTGKISKDAKNALKNNNKAKITKEHQFPRKLAAKALLKDWEKIVKKEIILYPLYEESYAKFNYVTPNENKKISKYQKEHIFTDIETAYKKAGVELLEISLDKLKELRKG